ncbi:hypothetical protein FB451DRAFT_1057983 [Mycena latifolia]|nr:hypothetical protein FB451DRAFT_1057983 [Mycena latifolia]
MRQKDQTVDDEKLRTALCNMRYASCTAEDIAFLNTKVAGFRSGNPRMDSGRFRNVSIITAWNAQKDVINSAGAKRFARDTNQELVQFCSVDRVSTRAVDKTKWRKCEQSPKTRIGERLQRQLWDALPTANSEMVPGCITLCIGIPVLLRSNDATELSMTKGQEGVVVGWDESVGPLGQRVLDTLFVKLLKVSKPVQISGLPLNVVPIPRCVTHTTILLQDDSLMSVMREQVTILLNFSMTDYSAQGKSRPVNPVDLTNCKDHRAYYVALSRGTTAEGTVIVQEFTTDKITSGMSGYLRQELRELELLDEITRLNFDGKLPRSVTGIYRRQLIRSYLLWRGDNPEPSHFHPAIRHNPNIDPEIPVALDYAEWRPSTDGKSKRKHNKEDQEDTAEEKARPRKKTKTKYKQMPTRGSVAVSDGLRGCSALSEPVGLIWDSRDYSCGYDAVFTILYNVWLENKEVWSTRFSAFSPLLLNLTMYLRQLYNQVITFEQARDMMRSRMHRMCPADFPYGITGTSIDRILRLLTPDTNYATGRQVCQNCGYVDPQTLSMLGSYMTAIPNRNQIAQFPAGLTTLEWLKQHLKHSLRRCPMCAIQGRRVRLVVSSQLREVPDLLFIAVDTGNIFFSQRLQLECNGHLTSLHLRGIIYGGQAHFTARFISSVGRVWFHDGMTTGRSCIDEGLITDLDPRSSAIARGKSALTLVYAKEL